MPRCMTLDGPVSLRRCPNEATGTLTYSTPETRDHPVQEPACTRCGEQFTRMPAYWATFTLYGHWPSTPVFYIHCGACDHDCASRALHCRHCGRVVDGEWVFRLPAKEITTMPTPPQPYGWIITEDNIANRPDESRANVLAVTAHTDITTHFQLTSRLKAGEGAQFRIFDGDGHLDYAGRIIVPAGQEGSARYFAPLNWAKRDTGSTEIHYLNADNGMWEVL